jgi:hypothetical protein
VRSVSLTIILASVTMIFCALSIAELMTEGRDTKDTLSFNRNTILIISDAAQSIVEAI